MIVLRAHSTKAIFEKAHLGQRRSWEREKMRTNGNNGVGKELKKGFTNEVKIELKWKMCGSRQESLELEILFSFKVWTSDSGTEPLGF